MLLLVWVLVHIDTKTGHGVGAGTDFGIHVHFGGHNGFDI